MTGRLAGTSASRPIQRLTRRDEGTLFMARLGAMERANVDLGVRLGLYETLATADAPRPWSRRHIGGGSAA